MLVEKWRAVFTCLTSWLGSLEVLSCETVILAEVFAG